MEFKLRPWNENDLDSLVKHANNDHIAQFLTNMFPHPYTREDGVWFITQFAGEYPDKVFAIEVNGEAVGAISVIPQTDIHEKNAELGYWLSEDYWGCGIMTRAIHQMVDYGFKTFDITRIFARPFSINPASQRVLEKAGFLLEARMVNALYKNGIFMDELIYAIRRPGSL